MPVQVISSNISSNAVVPDRSSSTSAPSTIRSASTSPQTRISSSEFQVDSVGQVSRAYQSLSETITITNQVADSVKQADSTMEKIGHTVNMMKGTLEGIIKNYPPFPPGSEQRVRALKGFAALRHEIEQMTFPPEPSQVPKLISDPAKTPGSFSVTLDSKGTSIQLDRQQMDPGPTGLNIPELPIKPPADASDGPIYNAISALETAAETVSLRRQSLSENFTQQALPAIVVSTTTQTGLSDSAKGAASLSEQTAASKSRDIGGIFSSISVGISVTNNTLLKRLT